MSDEETDLYYDAISTGQVLIEEPLTTPPNKTDSKSTNNEDCESGVQPYVNHDGNRINIEDKLKAELDKVVDAQANISDGATNRQKLGNKVLANIAKFESTSKDVVPINTSPVVITANKIMHNEKGKSSTDGAINVNQVETCQAQDYRAGEVIAGDGTAAIEDSLVSIDGAPNDVADLNKWEAVNNTEIKQKAGNHTGPDLYSLAKPFPEETTPNHLLSGDGEMTTVRVVPLVDSMGYSHARRTHDDVKEKKQERTIPNEPQPSAGNRDFQAELLAHVHAHQVPAEDNDGFREEFEQTIYDSVCDSTGSSGRTLDKSNDFEIVYHRQTGVGKEGGQPHGKEFGQKHTWTRQQAKLKTRTMKRNAGHPFTGHHEFDDPHKGAIPELEEEGGLMATLSPFNFSSASSASSGFSDSSFDSPISDFSDDNDDMTKLSYNDKPLPPVPNKKRSDAVSDEDAMMLRKVKLKRKRDAPSLPEAPIVLNPAQVKMRGVLQSLVDNEKNYISSLQRIVNEYKMPIINQYITKNKDVKVTFAKVEDILETHKMFEIELADKLKNWYENEKIGNIFHKFSQHMVLEAYSGYVNNFETTCDMIKETENSHKPFKEFLKGKQMLSSDRLSLPALMLKPVQRFPQLIMIIKDLLKYTPRDHHDREPLQEALTGIENVAHQLNERKRHTEQYNLGHQIISKLAPRVPHEKNAYLIRQDDMDQLAQDTNSTNSRYRLLMMNKTLICLLKRKKRDQDGASSERFTYKWHQNLKELELTTSAITPNMQTRVHAEPKNTTIFSPKSEPMADEDPYHVATDLTDMMHDLTVLAQISQLISTLKLHYQGLTEDHIQEMVTNLQKEIQGKDYQLQMLNSSSIILQDKVRKKKYVFSADNASMKQEWCIDFLMAKYALDIANIPSWHQQDVKGSSLHQPALLTKHMSVDMQRTFTKVKCAVRVYFPTRNDGLVEHMWVCSSTVSVGQVSIVSLHTAKPSLVESFQATKCEIVCVEMVPGFALVNDELAFQEDSVWMSTVDSEILVFMFSDQKSDSHRQHIHKFNPGCVVITMLYIDDRVFCGSRAGVVVIYSRNDDGVWLPPTQLHLDCSSITSIICVSESLWMACGNQIHIVDPENCTVQEKISHQMDDPGIHVQFLVKAGVGVWVSFHGQPNIVLYHSESKHMLQDLSICKAINEFIGVYTGEKTSSRKYEVTSLMASLGLLWVGTDLGIILTYPLPRLRDGVPRIHQRSQVALHGHDGPIRFLIPVHYGPVNAVPIRRRPSSILKRNNVDKSAISKLPKVEERDSGEHVYVTLDAEAMLRDCSMKDSNYESIDYGWRAQRSGSADPNVASKDTSRGKDSENNVNSVESGEHKYYVIWPQTNKYVPVDSITEESKLTMSDEHKYFILEPHTKQFVPVDGSHQGSAETANGSQHTSQESQAKPVQSDTSDKDGKCDDVKLRRSSSGLSDRPYSVDHVTDLRASYEGVSVRENPGRHARPKTFHNDLKVEDKSPGLSDESADKPSDTGVVNIPGLKQQPQMPNAFRAELRNKLKKRKSQENLTDLAVTKDGVGRLYETLMRPSSVSNKNDLCSSLPSNYSFDGSTKEAVYVRPRTTVAISAKKPDITASRFSSHQKQEVNKNSNEQASASKRSSTPVSPTPVKTKASIGSSFSAAGTVDTLRKQNSNTILVLSGGDGYKDWKKRHNLQNYRPQEPCLIFWMYRF